MHTSRTINYTRTERRPTRAVGADEDRRIVRVQIGRGDARRAAIAESAGWSR